MPNSDVDDSASPGQQQMRSVQPGSRLAIVVLIAGLAAVAIRLPFVAHLPLTWDNVQYVLGVLHYDVVLHQPHPPGYFLYLYAARALYLLGMSPYECLLAISLVSGALMVGLLTWWAGLLGGLRAAVGAAALIIASPLAWQYTTQGDTYAVSGLASAVVGYLCWRLYRDPRASVLPSAVALGLAGGLRPTDALFLLPLWLYCVSRCGVKRLTLGLVCFAAVCLSWLVPLVNSVGGWTRYGEVCGRLSEAVWAVAPIFGAWGYVPVFAGRLVVGVFAVLALGWIFVVDAGGSDLTRRPAFVSLWLAPAVVFYLVVHLANPGYVMNIMPPLLLLGAMGFERIMSERMHLAAVMLVVVICVNGLLICECIMKDRAALEGELREIATACMPYRGPATVALTTNAVWTEPPPAERWLPYRTAMYLLPEMRVYIFPLERPGPPGTIPNYGYELQSAAVVPPVHLHGICHLLLLGESLLQYLPPNTPNDIIVSDTGLRIYHVELDPTAGVTLGGNAGLTFHAAAP